MANAPIISDKAYQIFQQVGKVIMADAVGSIQASKAALGLLNYLAPDEDLRTEVLSITKGSAYFGQDSLSMGLVWGLNETGKLNPLLPEIEKLSPAAQAQIVCSGSSYEALIDQNASEAQRRRVLAMVKTWPRQSQADFFGTDMVMHRLLLLDHTSKDFKRDVLKIWDALPHDLQVKADLSSNSGRQCSFATHAARRDIDMAAVDNAPSPTRPGAGQSRTVGEALRR